jgi:hypothetical protein
MQRHTAGTAAIDAGGHRRACPSTRFARSGLRLAATLGLAAGIATTPASAQLLQQNRDDFAFGLSLGLGYASTDVAEGGTADLLATQVGVSGILWSHWEAALDLRIDLDPATPDARVRSYTALLWVIAHFDLLPLTPFVGAGGGVVLDGTDPRLVWGTIGACLGLALWFESTWRLTLRGAQRWVFDDVGAMPLEILLTAEYYF